MLKIKRQTRNNVEYACHFQRVSIFHNCCSSLFVFQLGVCTDRGGVVKQEKDNRGQGEGGG